MGWSTVSRWGGVGQVAEAWYEVGRLTSSWLPTDTAGG